MRRPGLSLPVQVAIAAGVSFAGALGFAATGASLTDLNLALPALIGNCPIKGNVAITGERIYHVPGQRFYGATQIDRLNGERWFCSEAEARAAGWRPSKV